MARPLGPRPKPKRSLLHTKCARKIKYPSGKVVLWMPPSEAITRIRLLAEDFRTISEKDLNPIVIRNGNAEDAILRVVRRNGERLEISYPANMHFVRQVARYRAGGTLIDLQAV